MVLHDVWWYHGTRTMIGSEVVSLIDFARGALYGAVSSSKVFARSRMMEASEGREGTFRSVQRLDTNKLDHAALCQELRPAQP